jgi:lysophospholipase L1-like esterase
MMAALDTAAWGDESPAVVKPLMADPLLLPPMVPAGEKLLLEGTSPGVRVWDQWSSGRIWNYGTTESVGDGAGMIIYAPPDAKGRVIAYDIGVKVEADADRNPTNWQGVCLWVKGDGSEAQGVLGWNWYVENPYKFSLKNASWHKLFVRWKDFRPPVLGRQLYFPNFTIERADTNASNWFIVDRVHLFKEEKVEEIRPTPRKDLPGDISAEQFLCGREHIGKTLQKLKAKKPVTIVIIGDSITAGAQLWYAPKEGSKERDMDQFRLLYAGIAAQGLAERFKYENPVFVWKRLDKEEWKTAVGADAKVGEGLSVVILGAGGRAAEFAVKRIDDILAFTPDLVVYQFGVNDAIYGSSKDYRIHLARCVDLLKAKGIEVVIGTPTPYPGIGSPYWNNGEAVSGEARRVAKETDCALLDMRKGFCARYPQCLGDLFSDEAHPNHRGHRIMGTLLLEMFTQQGLKIWEGVPNLKPRGGAQ